MARESRGDRMGAQKWQKWESEEALAVLRTWKMAGLSDEEVAKKVGVSRSTLAEWKHKHEKIGEALASGREFADRLVENKLFKLTQGYKVEVRKAFKLRKPVYDDNGKKTGDEEVLETAIEDEYVKPDVRAMIFWLQNRRPEEWRKLEERTEEESDVKRMVVLTPTDVERMREYASEDGREGEAGQQDAEKEDERGAKRAEGRTKRKKDGAKQTEDGAEGKEGGAGVETAG